MNINRNNYETFFLLYADKELSAKERAIVDAFVMQNPDLKEELNLLLQAVIECDDSLVFENKSMLLKEEKFISIDNYTEKFLLYNDNELSAGEMKATEDFVQNNSLLQDEFGLLQQIKFEPDNAIVFPDKRKLYKKEDRVIYMYWKAIAAAIILGVGLWIGLNYLPSGGKRTVENAVIEKPVNTIKTKLPAKPKIDSLEKNITPTESNIAEKTGTSNNSLVSIKKVSAKKPTNHLVIDKTVNDIVIKNQAQNQDVATLMPKKEIVIVEEPLNKENINTSSTKSNVTVIASSSPENIYAQITSYVADEEVKSENYIFYNITKEEFKKSKIGIFLKKVKRVVERKNPLRDRSFRVSSLPADQ